MFLYKHFVGGAEANEIDDIIRNLTFIFRTKRGCGYFIPTFGLSDVGYRTPEEMVVQVQAEIRENVRLYEPRVEVVDIDEVYDDDGHRASLVVNLMMRTAKDKLMLVVDLKSNSFDIRRATGTENAGDARDEIEA